MRSEKPLFAAVIIGLTLAACSGMSNPLVAPKPTPQEVAEQEGQMLAAAGFVQIPLDTPVRQQRMTTLVPLKVQYIVGRTGTIHYWMADPYGCECLYRGTEEAYQKYEQYKMDQQFNKQQAEIAQNSMEAAEVEQMDDNMELMNPYGIGFGPDYGW
jgi:hypothetical protein